MPTVSTTKLSSKGQVVIPEPIRKRLGLEEGDQFVVYGEKGVVILKALSAPSLDELDDLLAGARKRAKSAGIKSSDLEVTIKRTRRKK